MLGLLLAPHIGNRLGCCRSPLATPRGLCRCIRQLRGLRLNRVRPRRRLARGAVQRFQGSRGFTGASLGEVRPGYLVVGCGFLGELHGARGPGTVRPDAAAQAHQHEQGHQPPHHGIIR